jgi:hypothetical protein
VTDVGLLGPIDAFSQSFNCINNCINIFYWLFYDAADVSDCIALIGK